MSDPSPDVKIFKANQSLLLKTGGGNFSPEQIQKADSVIEDNTIDFTEIAVDYLLQLDHAVKQCRLALSQSSEEDHKQSMIKPVMALKAHGKMFRYDLITSLADIVLGFLEHIKQLDKDSIDIVDAHHKTLALIIHKKISGTGGGSGEVLRSELLNACRRYQSKNSDNFIEV